MTDNPPNPWQSQHVDYLGSPPGQELMVYEDHSSSILSENDSPGFSVNPYRGCQHACSYCYARPSHHYLGFGSGTDFERRIVVKPRAPELLRAAFERRSWRGELVLFSGNTDCYQPLEASYELTRRCLEVCAEFRNPVQIVTKAVLIERDIELVARLAREAGAGVSLSIPFWNSEHARVLEPNAPTPQRRIETVRRLSAAGIEVSVNLAPVIPGLSEPHIPHVLHAAAEAGARRGKLYDSRFGERFKGQGEYYAAIRTLFEQSARRAGLSGCAADDVELETPSRFRRPSESDPQLGLFD